MEQSLVQRLKEYNKTMLPMHMPGHKRNLALSGPDGYLTALCADCDITEIAGFDNLAEPEEILLSLKTRAAKLWKSEEAYPLVNGSTCGVLAAIYASVPYGGRVLVARNCHKSVYNGLQLVNAKVTYLLPEWDSVLGCFGEVTIDSVKDALEAMSDVNLIILTSPTYEGVLSDVEEICRAAHAKGVPVLVDSAHGAHLGFGGFPKGAVACGADLVVHSLHKTLPCLTQTAMLHRSGSLVSAIELQTAINMFQTSSPSYLLLASIEGCIGLMEKRGNEVCSDWEDALTEFYKGASQLQNVRVIGKYIERAQIDMCTEPKQAEFDRDPGKIVLCTQGTDLTGPELMVKLRTEYRIELEMAAEGYGLAMTGAGDTKKSLARLLQALLDVDSKCGKETEREMIAPKCPEVCLSIGEAVQSNREEVPIKEGVGRIAAEHLWAYPPGIPIVVAGEKVTEEIVMYLTEKQRQGVELHRKSGTCKEKLPIEVVV